MPSVAALKPGEVLLLENTRFYKEEEGKVKKTDDMTDEEIKAEEGRDEGEAEGHGPEAGLATARSS